MLQFSGIAMQNKQTRRITRLGRCLRDRRFREVVVKVRGFQLSLIMNFYELRVEYRKPMFLCKIHNSVTDIICMRPYTTYYYVTIRKIMSHTPWAKIKIANFVFWKIIDFRINIIQF